MAIGERAVRATAHRAKLHLASPRLGLAIERAGRHRHSLRARHEQYVTEVSDRENALSLELAGVLWAICDRRLPARIVDLGSGFSSYVLRSWAAPHAAEVWSVDSSPEWLARTSDYLVAAGVANDNLLGWDAFIERRPEPFDLVLHDLGGMGLRAETLGTALELVSPTGIAVLDDVHKDPYHSVATAELARRGWRRFNLRWATEDRFGRYAFAAEPTR